MQDTILFGERTHRHEGVGDSDTETTGEMVVTGPRKLKVAAVRGRTERRDRRWRGELAHSLDSPSSSRRHPSPPLATVLLDLDEAGSFENGDLPAGR